MKNEYSKEELRQLISDAAIGDRESMNELIKHYSSRMYFTARLYLKDKKRAQSVTENALRNAFRKLEEALQEDNFDLWLSRIVQAEALYRIMPITEETISGTGYSNSDEVVDPYIEVPEEDECKKRIYKIMDQLTDAERAVTTLHFYDHMSLRDVANTLNISTGNVMGFLRSAKRKMNMVEDESIGTYVAMMDKMNPDKSKTDSLPLEDVVPEEDIEPVTEVPEDNDTFLDDLKGMVPVDERTTRVPLETLQYETTRVPEPDIIQYEEREEIEEQQDEEKDYPILNIILIALIIIGIIVAVFLVRQIMNPSSASREIPQETAEPTPEPTPTPTPTPEVVEETPEPTEEPNPIIGHARVITAELRVRSGPGTSYNQVTTVRSGEEFDVYEIAEGGGYTWYRISEDQQWIANNGGMVQYTENE
ncbi:MAG: sigma-70 family RNA polymerase sigma factor [Solobacterium sp.]|nr:sigma-70 family RNA polymerase sigma factor [Solobacterium sp.]